MAAAVSERSGHSIAKVGLWAMFSELQLGMGPKTIVTTADPGNRGTQRIGAEHPITEVA